MIRFPNVRIAPSKTASGIMAKILSKFCKLIGILESYIFQGCMDSATSFVEGLKPVILVGRLLFVLPRGDVLCGNEDSSKFSIGVIRSCILAILFFANFILQTIANVSRFNSNLEVYQKLHELILPVYSFTIFFIYAYFLIAAKQLRSLISKILQINKTQCIQGAIHFQSSHDIEQAMKTSFQPSSTTSTYPRFCLFTLTFIMVYGILENVTYDVQNLRGADTKLANSTLQRYYLQSFYHWIPYVPHNSCLTLVCVILLKCGTYAWIFGDIIVIVLCRAVSERLKVLNEEIQQAIDPPFSAIATISGHKRFASKSGVSMFPISWDEVRFQYMALQDLMRDMGKFISPLMLSCYGINVYLLIINLFYWIVPNTSLSVEQTFYSYFAFAHFSFRVWSVTYFVADVYHVGTCLGATLQKCPNSLYTLSMERLERSMLFAPCGITLFGTFVITRKFFISIISFIFTTEIVLLQTTK